MGGKYSIMARQLEDFGWEYDWYGNSFIKFICKSVYALTRYEVVQMGKHGNQKERASDGFNEQNRNDNVRRRYTRNCIGNNSADTRYGT